MEFWMYGLLLFCTNSLLAQHSVYLQIEHHWGGRGLSFETTYEAAGGVNVQMERVSYLISELRLRDREGRWIELKDQVWFVDASLAAGGVARVGLGAVPVGDYDRMRMTVGLNKATDDSDPNSYPAEHALNPVKNQLHWSWSGGYIYMALEGLYSIDEKESGFSYHLAGQANKIALEFETNLLVDGPKQMEFAWDIGRCFDGSKGNTLGVMPDTTHSAEDDEWAPKIRDLVKSGWELRGISNVVLAENPKRKSAYQPHGTPFPITIKPWMPRAALPEGNYPSKEGVRLGKELFFDERLSSGLMSCASCHHHEVGFTDHGKAVSMGVKGEFGTRNSMPLLNLLWSSEFFWDGHAPSLREQALMPITSEIEMNETLDHVVAKLLKDKSMVLMFQKAFGSAEVTPERIGLALEQFMVTLIAQESKFDLAMTGDKVELTDQERRGMELFFTESDPRRNQHGADCFHCHGGGLFTNQAYMDNGLDEEYTDLGRFLVTGRERDKGRFKVPSLRNVALTSPYMHDGRFGTLEEVVKHYNEGVLRSPNLDPNLAKHQGRGLGLSEEDQACLVAFLKTLTEWQ